MIKKTTRLLSIIVIAYAINLVFFVLFWHLLNFPQLTDIAIVLTGALIIFLDKEKIKSKFWSNIGVAIIIIAGILNLIPLLSGPMDP